MGPLRKPPFPSFPGPQVTCSKISTGTSLGNEGFCPIFFLMLLISLPCASRPLMHRSCPVFPVIMSLSRNKNGIIFHSLPYSSFTNFCGLAARWEGPRSPIFSKKSGVGGVQEHPSPLRAEAEFWVSVFRTGGLGRGEGGIHDPFRGHWSGGQGMLTLCRGRVESSASAIFGRVDREAGGTKYKHGFLTCLP